MKKIAVEEHFTTPELERAGAIWKAAHPFPTLMSPEAAKKIMGLNLAPFEEDRLPGMDKNDIQMQLIATCTPGVHAYDPEEAVEKAKEINNQIAGFMKQYPGRFCGFASLPLQKPQAAAEEFERCIKDLGFCGAMVQGHINYEYLDNPKFYPVWEVAQSYDAPITLHVSSPEFDQTRMYEGCPWILGPTWNWGYYIGTQALKMIFTGLFDKFPDAKLVLGHMGESLPYLLGRLDEGWLQTGADKDSPMKNPPSYYIQKNIYINTSGQYRPETMTCAISAMGIDKIMFATDYPHYSFEDAVANVEACDLTDEQKKKIYYENAARIFHLENL